MVLLGTMLCLLSQCLDQHFPDHLIGTNCSIEWPLRSPDISPLTSFYAIIPLAPLKHVRQRITNEHRQITPGTLQQNLYILLHWSCQTVRTFAKLIMFDCTSHAILYLLLLNDTCKLEKLHCTTVCIIHL